MAERRFDLPTIDQESEPFWSAAREGRLVVRRCRSCGEAHHYPRPFCPSCWSDEVEWVDASGRARLYTYSTVYRNDLPPWPERVPYVAAVVELEEGPRMMTQIVGCEPDEVRIGMELEAVFDPLTDEVTRVLFRPAG